MKAIRSLSLAFNAIATVCLTIRAAIHDPAIYAVGVFCMGAVGCLAISQLLIKGENKKNLWTSRPLNEEDKEHYGQEGENK